MGNICSNSISIQCDIVFSRCLDCTIRKAAYISELEDNVGALKNELQKLIEARDDVMIRVVNAEQQQMQRLNQVQGWLSRVEAEGIEVGELIEDSSQEIEKLCLGGYCSKNSKSSYKFGKKVAKKLQIVATLTDEGVFEVVAERVEKAAVDERPIEPTIVGLQSTFDKVWRCLEEEQVGIVALYGMGGVGKTALLTQINNKFLDMPGAFDFVIWVVVSKDLQLGSIQEKIAKKIGLFDESWKGKSLEEKAIDIFIILRKKKFILLLDDIWERVDLTKVGIPIPRPEVASKIVFTTRFLDVCGLMEADKWFKVECLIEDEVWELFQKKVGKETLDIHPHIPGLAKTVAKECGGLPLALITIGRAMSCKKTPEEWSYAIQVLRRSASEFAGMGKEVYPLLKFSYDSLSCDKIRLCLLYCTLFPEDYSIEKTILIDCWIGEGFLDEYDGSEAQNEGYSIIGVLVRASLLEEGEGEEEYTVKIHDVIRDMALWIACEIEKENFHFLVHAGAGLTEAPKIEKWRGVIRMSLMQNKIEDLSEVPTSPDLRTLFLNSNDLRLISNGFFQFMSSLRVLNLSKNVSQTNLASTISNLVSLKYLDLSHTAIKELPIELKALINLKCLGLEHTPNLHKIPCQLISSFSMLHVLRMEWCGYYVAHIEVAEDSILFGTGAVLVDELVGLKYLNVLTISLRSFHALKRFLSTHKFLSCTRSLVLEKFLNPKSLNVLSLADFKHLHTLYITFCPYLEELNIEHIGVVQKAQEPYGFHSLHTFRISFCSELRDLTWLVFVPSLKFLSIFGCAEMEEIISVGKLGKFPEMMANLNPFPKLQNLYLHNQRNLKSIYWKALPFPHLKEIKVYQSPELKTLPFDSNSAEAHKIVIQGEEHWWKQLQWEDQATLDAFLPCFKSL